MPATVKVCYACVYYDAPGWVLNAHQIIACWHCNPDNQKDLPRPVEVHERVWIRRREVEELPYGSPEQIRFADVWFERFMKLWLEYILRNKCEDETARPIPSWLYRTMESAYKKVHLNDVWYTARQRWNYRVREIRERTTHAEN